MIEASARRTLLLDWMRERPTHSGLTAQEIVAVSGIYEGRHGRYDRCLRDLTTLWADNKVIRLQGRPARWCA